MFEKLWQGISAILAVICLSILAYALWLKSENIQLQSEIDAYNLTIDIAAKEMQEKANELPKVVKEIEYRTQQKIQVVKEYVYDNNQSECDNAIALLRRTGF